MNVRAVVLLWATGIISVSTNIPNYIRTCHQSDGNIAQCISESIRHLKPWLKIGIPELGIPRLEPMRINDIYLRNDPRSTSNQVKLTGINVIGISDFELEKSSVNAQENTFTFSVRLPILSFVGNYQLKMKFSFLNIQDKGTFSGNFTDYRFTGSLRGRVIKKGDVQYLEFEVMKIIKSTGKVHVHLKNLFNGDKELTDLANAVINENTELLFAEIKPALENSIALLFTTVANKIVSSFTYKEIFPK
ncbi:hypothetical protein Trydic_g490 [Trypoxylus dichotomus]